MADYHSLLAKAVDALDPNTPPGLGSGFTTARGGRCARQSRAPCRPFTQLMSRPRGSPWRRRSRRLRRRRSIEIPLHRPLQPRHSVRVASSPVPQTNARQAWPAMGAAPARSRAGALGSPRCLSAPRTEPTLDGVSLPGAREATTPREERRRLAYGVHGNSRCPVGLSGTRQASAPALGANLRAGAARSSPTSPQSPHPGSGHPGPHDGFLGVQADQNSPATMHTEFDMRAPLFPKEQVPASTPTPPRGRDHFSSRPSERAS
jgi:hypothetical protein